MPMKRREFMKISGGTALLTTVAGRLGATLGPRESGGTGAADAGTRSKASIASRTSESVGPAPSFPTRILSRMPPLRWEDAMISGNGPAGIMVMGTPLDDLVVVNHEKLWVVNSDFKPVAPDLVGAWTAARKMAEQRRYRDADESVVREADRILRGTVRPVVRGMTGRTRASTSTSPRKATVRPRNTGARRTSKRGRSRFSGRTTGAIG
jgi:hypothetical protein